MHSRNTATSTWSQHTVAAIKDWLQDDLHDTTAACTFGLESSAATDLLPTRLLRLEQAPEGVVVRLIISSNLSEGANNQTKYATLSHCWGGAVRSILTYESMIQLMQGMPIADFPRTFRDAFAVVLALDINHVWIDALCIIQDSDYDWLREASLMTRVYRNSWINIAATASTNCDGGLFLERDPLPVAPCIIQLERSSQQIRLERSQQQGYVCYREEESYHSIMQSPLSRRAWVLQERLLAPRTIHFAADQVCWQSEIFVKSEGQRDWNVGPSARTPDQSSSRKRNLAPSVAPSTSVLHRGISDAPYG